MKISSIALMLGGILLGIIISHQFEPSISSAQLYKTDLQNLLLSLKEIETIRTVLEQHNMLQLQGVRDNANILMHYYGFSRNDALILAGFAHDNFTGLPGVTELQELARAFPSSRDFIFSETFYEELPNIMKGDSLKHLLGVDPFNSTQLTGCEDDPMSFKNLFRKMKSGQRI